MQDTTDSGTTGASSPMDASAANGASVSTVTAGGPPPLTPVEQTMIEAQVIEQLHTTYDPEIPIDIFELGLIYDVQVSAEGVVGIRMTLTAPNCPGAESIPTEVYEKVLSIQGVRRCVIDVVWDPPWSPAKMSEAAKLALGFL
ncbi:MAG: iron-sulfur cluster assembly protein [Thermoplasmatota archaeon]